MTVYENEIGMSSFFAHWLSISYINFLEFRLMSRWELIKILDGAINSCKTDFSCAGSMRLLNFICTSWFNKFIAGGEILQNVFDLSRQF